MLKSMCLVCSDKQKYSNEVSKERNLVYELMKRTTNGERKPFTNEENAFLRQLENTNKHPHFMCGHCSQVNTQELKNLERKLNEQLVLVARKVINENDNGLFHQTLRLLAGEYGGKYRSFEIFCKKKQNQKEKCENS